MDGDDMNDRTESAQNIKGFTAVNITEDKATRIRRVLRISLNDLAFGNDVLDFRQGNTTAVTASLAMPRDLKCTAVNFLTDFFNHRIIFSRQRVTQEVWGCQAVRYSFGTFAPAFVKYLTCLTSAGCPAKLPNESFTAKQDQISRFSALSRAFAGLTFS